MNIYKLKSRDINEIHEWKDRNSDQGLIEMFKNSQSFSNTALIESTYTCTLAHLYVHVYSLRTRREPQ